MPGKEGGKRSGGYLRARVNILLAILVGVLKMSGVRLEGFLGDVCWKSLESK